MARYNNQVYKLKLQKKEVEQKLTQLVSVMGVEAKNFYQKSFEKQGFTDRVLEKWKKRKPRMRGGINIDAGRAILVKSGDLRRSIRVISKTLTTVTVGSNLKYAPVHNLGLRAGRGRGFKMPKRQFMGESKKLDAIIRRKIQLAIKVIFNKRR